MSAAWPREHDATVAVEAAAKAVFEAAVKGTSFAQTSWDDVDFMAKLEFRKNVLVPVWAALAAIPDPRHQAWEEGNHVHHFGSGNSENPYESGV